MSSRRDVQPTDVQPIDVQPRPAGMLHRRQTPVPPETLRTATLEEVAGEVLARIRTGAFSETEQGILLGLSIEDALRSALNVHNNRFSLRRFRDLFGSLYEQIPPESADLDGATVVDLGCGSMNPFGFLFPLLMLGARRGVAIDLDEVEDWTRATTALADIAAEALLAPECLFGTRAIPRERMLRNVDTFDFQKLRSGDLEGVDSTRLIHRNESVHALSLERAEAGFVFSTAFFEHIPSVEEAIVELARVTRIGGIGAHVIDCTDHRRYGDPRMHPLEFLTEDTTDELVHGSNRLRVADFAALFERCGFEVLLADVFGIAEIDAGFRARLAPRFRAQTDEALSQMFVTMVVRRC